MEIKKPETFGLLVAITAVVVLFGLFKLFPEELPERAAKGGKALHFVLDQRSVKKAGITDEAPSGEFLFAYELTEEGRGLLARATAASVGRMLAFEIGGEVIASPIIKDVMSGEKGMISMKAEHRPQAEALIASVTAGKGK